MEVSFVSRQNPLDRSTGAAMTVTETEPTTKLRIFSGIQPTGQPHVGNYSGGFRQYKATQDSGGDPFFCIVDLHAITVPHDPAELKDGTLDMTAMLFATGLDPGVSTIFVQSHVAAHAEAAWLLSAVTSYGQLGRMTQFKEKRAEQEFVSAGLFTYPILMAGDILLYQTHVVPIGDDKRQHLELAREIRYEPDEKPGIANLIEILAVATGDTIEEIERRFDGEGYGTFKEAVGDAVVELLAPIRERYEILRADERELQRLLAVGAEKARRAAEPTLETMYERMGFVRSEAGRFFGAARPRKL